MRRVIDRVRLVWVGNGMVLGRLFGRCIVGRGVTCFGRAAGRILVGRLLLGRLHAGRLLAGRLHAGRILLGRSLVGRRAVDRPQFGDDRGINVVVGRVMSGEDWEVHLGDCCVEEKLGAPMRKEPSCPFYLFCVSLHCCKLDVDRSTF